jgi:hypothetical protein
MFGEYAYYASVSGLTPPELFSLADHKTAFWAAQTGLPTSVGFGRLRQAMYSAAGGEYEYFLSNTGLTRSSSLSDLKVAFFADPPSGEPAMGLLMELSATVPG